MKLSIITATFNAEKYLPNLIESISMQSDKDFEWVVADGLSTDETIDILNKAKLKINNLVVDSRIDTGISDAINRAIRLSSGEYFVIIGADDTFHPNAIYNFKKYLNKFKPDILCSKVMSDGKELKIRRPSWLWLYGSSAKIACTAIGTAYNKSLVSKVGYFDTKMQIYADGLFALKAIKNGSKIVNVDFISGNFAMGGISNSNPLISFSEDFRTKLICGFNLYIQLFLFSLRVIKSRKRILPQRQDKK